MAIRDIENGTGFDFMTEGVEAESLEIAPEIWEKLDGDASNAVIQQRYHDMPLDEVMQKLLETREATLKKLATLTQEDLLLPYHHYQPNSTEERPIIGWVAMDTIHHHHDHIPWIAAIVGEE